ncbi:hypothetical protein Hypma_013970 [Hypsizygus marmoreus]|uniref:Uncharacterized protein n=1 Tax=Hypsizygus marmoreus TaxID=39966 RepID=A0A369K5F9_HYPMA|nr:hypothetical protein Hypma_013970 [Hypsizygus marmoreus]
MTSTTTSRIADRLYARHTRNRPHIKYFARNREGFQMNLFTVYVYMILTISTTEQETCAARYREVRDSVDKMGPEVCLKWLSSEEGQNGRSRCYAPLHKNSTPWVVHGNLKSGK